MSYDNPKGPVYTASIATTALSSAGPHDLFVLASTSASRVAVLDIEVTQSSSAPAIAQSLGLRLWRGTTSTGTGAAITPAHIHGWSTMAAVSGVTANSSTIVSTASAVLLHAAALDAAGGNWRYKPCSPPILNTNQRMHLTATTPQTTMTTPLHVTVTFAEIGKPASS